MEDDETESALTHKQLLNSTDWQAALRLGAAIGSGQLRTKSVEHTRERREANCPRCSEGGGGGRTRRG